MTSKAITAVAINDYRNTSFKVYDFTLNDKKDIFMNEFRKVHIRAWDIYSNIKSRSCEFNKPFKQIYHNKCVYCGIDTNVIEISRFEIDHFIPQTILKQNLGYDKKYINGIHNLVNSCNMCNRNKSGFIISQEGFELLHPDNQFLSRIFNRLEDCSIVINNEYNKNMEIKRFYTLLNLDNQIRRLDFLIMEMKDFCERYPNEYIIPQLNALILKIENKRRKNY